MTLVLSEQTSTEPSPCKFCARGEITMPDKPLSIPGYEFIDSCGTIDAILPSMVMEGSPQCDTVQSISSLCGCPKPQDSCSFCPDGTLVPLPDKQVPWLSEQFGGVAPTCDVVEAYVASLSETDESCEALQLTSSYCGCPPLTNHCKFCQGEPLKEEFYDKELSFLLNSEEHGTMGIGITPTCEVIYATQYQMENDLEFGSDCFASRYVVINCGCNDGKLFYHGTADAAKQKILVWLPRAVGMVSLCASILVLFHILGDPNKRDASLYHQLVGAAAVFDMITSMVWIVGPAAMNPIDPLTNLEFTMYGAAGNASSCKVQSYFFQLGLTSVFLNVSLTAYFMLVIVFGYREQRLKKKRMWLFGAPIALGFALSFAVIPFTFVAYTHCQFDVRTQWIVVVFGLIPILGSSFSILVMLLIIYCSVRRQFRRQRRWDFNAGSSNNNPSFRESRQLSSSEDHRQKGQEERAGRRSRLEQLVFRQCVAYAAAFAMTWPLLGVALIEGADQNLPYGFWVCVTATAAVQGFNNALCYFRLLKNPRIAFCCRGFRKTCCRARGSARSDRINSSLSLVRLPQSTVDPRSLEEPASTSCEECSRLDPTVELANLSEDEDEASVTASSAVPKENVIAESTAVHTVWKFDVVSGSGLVNQQELASFQGSLQDMKQPEFDDEKVLQEHLSS